MKRVYCHKDSSPDSLKGSKTKKSEIKEKEEDDYDDLEFDGNEDDETLDFKVSELSKKGGKKRIQKTIKKYMKDKYLSIEDRRPGNIMSFIRTDFKFGKKVDKHIYSWLRNKRKEITKTTEDGVLEIYKGYVDPVIKKLFTEQNYADLKHIDILTQILDQNIPYIIKQHYYDIELSQIKKMILDNASLVSIQNQILKLPQTIQILGMLLICDTSSNLDKRINIIENILIPILVADIPLSNLQVTQIENIYSFIKDIDISLLINEQSALKLITLLKMGKIQDYDFIRVNCGHLGKEFWENVFQTLEIQQELQLIFEDHKDSMFTNTIRDYVSENLLNTAFFATLSKFSILTRSQVDNLAVHQRETNYNRVLRIVKSKPKISFNDYLIRIKPFVNFKGNLSNELITQLEKTPFHKWDQLHKLLGNYLIDNNNATSLVKRAITQSIVNTHSLKMPNTSTMQSLKDKLEKEYQKLKFKFPSLLELEWQKLLICNIYHISTTLNRKALQIKLSTGHGKSILIQLTAQLISGKVYIVCMNSFLTIWAKSLYYVIENKNIQYISLQEFLRLKPEPETTVILDEVDMMNGCNSFYIDSFNKNPTCYYLHSVLKGYKYWIGFSATFSACGRECSHANFDDSTFINIESVNEFAAENGLIGYKVASIQENKFASITQVISEQQEVYKNFIVILEDKKEAEDFFSSFEKPQNKQTLLINDFSKFQETIGKIQKLMAGDFIVVTTREGGIGVDFKGTDVAHVIIGFEYSTFSELKQALGRGSRESDKRCTGTLIAKREPYCSVESIIDCEELEDQRRANSILTMEKVARFLHGRNLTEEQISYVMEFQARMKKGMNFINEEDINDNKGMILFENLKKCFDLDGKVMIAHNKILVQSDDE